MKKTLAIILSLCMILSCFSVAGFSVQAADSTEAVGADITVYFTDALNWGSANIYYWNNGPQWPGSAMTVSETNEYNQKVYKATVPSTVTGIIFNGNGKQTVDITEGIEDGAQWYTTGETENGKFKVVKVETTVTPATTAAPVSTRKVYFDNSSKNYINPKAYVWEGTSNNYKAWPGENMTLVSGKVYSYEFPATYTKIIFTDGSGNQTDDLTLPTDGKDLYDGTTWSVYGSQTATTAAPTTVQPTNTITVYFTDALGWGSANVYYWDNAPQWPGTAMEKYEVNDYSQQVYKATVPADAKGIIFNNGSAQTVDIETGIEDGAQWYPTGETENGKYKVNKVGDEPVVTTAPATTVPATTVPATTTPANTITVYFTDALGWGAANVYYWGVDNTPEWPGVAMTADVVNDYNQQVYKATVPADVTGIIFNGNGNQTVDITKGIADGAQWYTVNETEDGKYKVEKVGDEPVETTVPATTVPATTVPETTAPDDSITVYFTDALGWGAANVYYWGVDNTPEWPGVAMTADVVNDYNQQVYKATVPADVTGIIFNGNGNQTVDITEGIADGAQWYTVNETEDGKYKVEKVGDEPTETTVPVVETTAPAARDFYLVGYINGVDYGIGDDSASLGDYKFVDGEVIVTLTEPSYVAVKDSNLTVYMTNGYLENMPTVATLYNESTLGNNADKLYVPAGTIAFKVADNGDDTLTLSYAGASAETTTAPDDSITVYFTDALGWGGANIYYWHDGPEWPGVAMTADVVNDYNQQVYKATVPADVTGIIFNGNGNQTVDITEGIADGAQWYTVNETEDGKYKVEKVGDEPVETTVPATTVPATTVPETTAPDDSITVYFTDTLGWGSEGDVYVYYDSNYDDEMPDWPGEPMEAYELNDYNQQVYKATILTDYANRIIFSNGNDRTVDICDGIENGAHWYALDSTTDGQYDVVKVGISGSITVYFTDALGWGGANIYYWHDGPEWPGNAMTVSETNNFGQTVYKAEVPVTVTGIIFNGGANQTVDITEGIEDGAQWYTINETIENGSYKVVKVGDEPVEPTTVPETTAPADTITVYFTDALGWGGANIYYWHDGPEWPGVAMTADVVNDYNQQVYKATVPADVTGIIFNGNGNQTVDITEGIADGAQWYTVDETEDGKYKVVKVGDEPVEPTTVPETTVPTTKDYYLVGYINGVDYGIEDDYQSLGDYKFVNSKVTVTFTEESYVAVKSSDFVMYMTNGYLENKPTSASLYNSATLGENANKLYVPAGTVTFTLTDNGDDTMVLSYVLEGEDHTHVPQVVNGRAATHFETGLTAGSVCSVCGEVLLAQEEIPVLEGYPEKGDINDDGYVNIIDVTLLQKMVAGLVEYTDKQAHFADVTGDTQVNVSDVTLLQKYLAKLVDESALSNP